VIEDEKLVERAASNGSAALAHLEERIGGRDGILDVRGRGLVLAIECDEPQRAADLCERALAAGVITLLSGDDGRVVSLTPPLCIEHELLERAIDIIADGLR